MKWDMEIEEIEAVLEKIWDLHDKLSDAIHSITRAHFLDSIKSLRKSDKKKQFGDAAGDESRSGFVFVKDFRAEESESAIQEAKSLNAIRTALENLEDQLDFLHTVQIQQRAERDAAIARLEQSRIILAMRLAEHHGKKYKVIEEALAFVGDVDTGRFVSPENLYGAPVSPSGANKHEGKASDILIKVLFSSFDFAKRSLNFKHMGGILNNAALFAVSMLVMLHLHPVARKEPSKKQKDNIKSSINSRKIYQLDVPSSHGRLGHLDVLLGRG